jgi:hypothetical protein
MTMRPALSGLACLLALAQATAKELPATAPSPGKPHVVRAKAVKAASLKAASLGVPISDPYAPPLGSGKPKSADFLRLETSPPVEPKGGFTLKAGRDSPDAPMTGGLMFRF